MTQRPIMKGQTHFTELNIDGDRVIAVCGDMDVQIVPSLADEDQFIVMLPEGSQNATMIRPDQLPDLIAALQRANDYLQGRG